ASCSCVSGLCTDRRSRTAGSFGENGKRSRTWLSDVGTNGAAIAGTDTAVMRTTQISTGNDMVGSFRLPRTGGNGCAGSANLLGDLQRRAVARTLGRYRPPVETVAGSQPPCQS